jgi:hypothetical protein
MKLPDHASFTKNICSAAVLLALALRPEAVMALEEPPGTPKQECPTAQDDAENPLVKEPTLEPEAPPKDCPMCGTWRIHGSNRYSLKGAAMEVTRDLITIPGCGVFGYSKTQPLSERFVTRPISLQILCQPRQALQEEEGVQFDVRFEHTFKDHSHASMTLNFVSSHEPMLKLHAWNLSVLDPCDTGSGMGSVACGEAHNAKAVELLTSEARSIPPTAAKHRKTAEPFNAHRYASQVLEACQIREAGNGGGAWPYAWALSCQAEYLKKKTQEVLAWNDCMAGEAKARTGYASYFPTQSRCKPPTEDFDIDTGTPQPAKAPKAVKHKPVRH